MKHTPLESQDCQRQAVAFNKLDWRYREVFWNRDDAWQGLGCLDAPDLLTGETLYDPSEGCFQWTMDRD